MFDLSQIDAVAFDLDGTLIDSAPDISHALNSALAQAGLRRFDLAAVRAWIGDGPDALIARALDAQGVDAADKELRLRLRRAFDVATLAAPFNRGSIYDGIFDLITGMRRELPMLVVTNKPTPLARAVLGASQLLQWLAGVHGADTPLQRKPAPSMLLAAAKQVGVAPERLLMVGDGATDLLAAKAAGCPAALVAWGYGSHALPAGLSPWRVETPRHLLTSLIRRRIKVIND